MSDIALEHAETYAARHQFRLTKRLGFGIHGIVLVAQEKVKKHRSAVKAHNSAEFYFREHAVYERLREAGVTEVLGFHVPQLIRAAEDLCVIEMTIVTRPFLLDFAGAYLDKRPAFSDEIWGEWESQKREQFGDRWKTVQAVINALEGLGIYLVDVTPANIAFAESPWP
jgi:hypothetical protein